MKELKKDTKIALLMGGPGSEREVSLASGNGVLEALRNEGFTHVTPVLVDSERPAIPEGTELCYNMIHGTYGEDGTPNAMNAAWGGISEEKEISICVDSGHKTAENVIARKAFTVSSPDLSSAVYDTEFESASVGI